MTAALILDQAMVSSADRSTILVVGDRIATTEPTDGAMNTRVDATGLRAVPGFIDAQVNGGFGIDLASEPERLWELGELLPTTGVTAFLPTVISGPPEIIDRAIATLANRPAEYVGAEPLGLHLEGPFLSPDRRGAHPADWLRLPELDAVERWMDGAVRLVTIAPELPGATATIDRLTSAGVVVSAGHSAATSDQAHGAFDAGVTAVTHLFNAMAPLHQREPGLAGAALVDDRVVCGLIADGVHLHPATIELVWRAKGARGVMLVTDAVSAAGSTTGDHRLGDDRVSIDAGTAVRRPTGELAGSVLLMNQAVANLAAFTGCSVDDAVECATSTPASLLGLDDRGRLDTGSIADIVLVDEQFEVALAICRGRIVHAAADHAARITEAQHQETD